MFYLQNIKFIYFICILFAFQIRQKYITKHWLKREKRKVGRKCSWTKRMILAVNYQITYMLIMRQSNANNWIKKRRSGTLRSPRSVWRTPRIFPIQCMHTHQARYVHDTRVYIGPQTPIGVKVAYVASRSRWYLTLLRRRWREDLRSRQLHMVPRALVTVWDGMRDKVCCGSWSWYYIQV